MSTFPGEDHPGALRRLGLPLRLLRRIVRIAAVAAEIDRRVAAAGRWLYKPRLALADDRQPALALGLQLADRALARTDLAVRPRQAEQAAQRLAFRLVFAAAGAQRVDRLLLGFDLPAEVVDLVAQRLAGAPVDGVQLVDDAAGPLGDGGERLRQSEHQRLRVQHRARQLRIQHQLHRRQLVLRRPGTAHQILVEDDTEATRALAQPGDRLAALAQRRQQLLDPQRLGDRRLPAGIAELADLVCDPLQQLRRIGLLHLVERDAECGEGDADLLRRLVALQPDLADRRRERSQRRVDRARIDAELLEGVVQFLQRLRRQPELGGAVAEAVQRIDRLARLRHHRAQRHHHRADAGGGQQPARPQRLQRRAERAGLAAERIQPAAQLVRRGAERLQPGRGHAAGGLDPLQCPLAVGAEGCQPATDHVRVLQRQADDDVRCCHACLPSPAVTAVSAPGGPNAVAFRHPLSTAGSFPRRSR